MPWAFLLAAVGTGIALAGATGVLVCHSRGRRRQRWQGEHARLSVRLEPILAPARESLDGQDLATEAEEWLGARPDE